MTDRGPFTTPEPRIRRAEEPDGAAIADLFVTVNRDLAPPDRRQAFEDYIALSLREEIGPFMSYYAPERGNGLWVAIAEDHLAGMYGLERVSDAAVELRRMYVAPGWRRKGLARRMLSHAEAMARELGYGLMILSTSELQEAALALYRAEGFRFVREETAEAKSNKTIGGGIVRHHFEKKACRGDARPGAAWRLRG